MTMANLNMKIKFQDSSVFVFSCIPLVHYILNYLDNSSHDHCSDYGNSCTVHDTNHLLDIVSNVSSYPTVTKHTQKSKNFIKF